MRHIKKYNNPNTKNPSIIYDLSLIDEGFISASNHLINIFYLDTGQAFIVGGNNTVNNFIFTNIKFCGSINLGGNSTNIINTSLLENQIITVAIYERIGAYQSGHISIGNDPYYNSTIQGGQEISKITYQGSYLNQDKVFCTSYNFFDFNQTQLRNHVLVNTQGTLDVANPDQINNCSDVVVMPNMHLTGGDNDYMLYLRTKEYADIIKNINSISLESNIEVSGNISLFFQDITLLKTAEFQYISSNNSLIITMSPWDKESVFILTLSNYITNKNNTAYTIYDHDQIVINPVLGKGYDDQKIDNFILHYVSKHDIYNSVKEDCIHVANDTKAEYKILNLCTFYNQQKSIYLGTNSTDILSLNNNNQYYVGDGDSDVYLLDVNSKIHNATIDNYALDKKLDTLQVPHGYYISDIKRSQNTDLLIKIKKIGLSNLEEIKIKILHYFESASYQHMILVDKQDLYIPFNHKVLEVVPFCHASNQQNVFYIKNGTKRAVLDCKSKDLLQYKNYEDLVLICNMDNDHRSFSVVLNSFFSNPLLWNDTKLYSYDDNKIDYEHELNLNQKALLRNNILFQKVDTSDIFVRYVIDFDDNSIILHDKLHKDNTLQILCFQQEEPVNIIVNYEDDDIILSRNGLNGKFLIHIEKSDKGNIENDIIIYEFTKLPFLVEPITIYTSYQHKNFSNQLIYAQELYKGLKFIYQSYKDCISFQQLQCLMAYKISLQDPLLLQIQALGFSSEANFIKFVQQCDLNKEDLIYFNGCIDDALMHQYKMVTIDKIYLNPPFLTRDEHYQNQIIEVIDNLFQNSSNNILDLLRQVHNVTGDNEHLLRHSREVVPDGFVEESEASYTESHTAIPSTGDAKSSGFKNSSWINTLINNGINQVKNLGNVISNGLKFLGISSDHAVPSSTNKAYTNDNLVLIKANGNLSKQYSGIDGDDTKQEGENSYIKKSALAPLNHFQLDNTLQLMNWFMRVFITGSTYKDHSNYSEPEARLDQQRIFSKTYKANIQRCEEMLNSAYKKFEFDIQGFDAQGCEEMLNSSYRKFAPKLQEYKDMYDASKKFDFYYYEPFIDYHNPWS